MTHVRRHQRVTVTGRTVTVRAHEREGDDGMRPVPEWSRPPYVGDLTPVADERGTSPEFRGMFLDDDAVEEDIWADYDDVEVGAVTAACPECGSEQPVQLGGTLGGHRPAGSIDYCPGSGSEIA